MVRIAAIAGAVILGAGLIAMTLLTRDTGDDTFAQCRAGQVAGGAALTGGHSMAFGLLLRG